jgi:S1-C subfamily serine protease
MFVPIDTLKPVLGDFIANGRATTKPRPWLGITSQEIQGKVIVTRVSSDGPAEEAGLQAGDIIVGLGGQALAGQADFYTRLWKSGDAGVVVTLDVLKGNKIEPVKVKSIARELHFRSKPVY